MKNFDLNSYGVQEMDAKAMEEANGGGFWRNLWDGYNDYINGKTDCGRSTSWGYGIGIGIGATVKDSVDS